MWQQNLHGSGGGPEKDWTDQGANRDRQRRTGTSAAEQNNELTFQW